MKINLEKIYKNLENIKDSYSQIVKISSKDENILLEDRISLGALKFELIISVEAICNILTHLLSKVKNKACSGYIDCIKKAKDFSLISESLGEKLIGLAKLRNLLVHRYWDIDDKLLLKEVKTHKDDLLSFVEEIENNLKNFCKEEKND
ncbi:hypothetical protein THC_0564 [Caldimicrobium thiodismutans]|uniref:DUF86 domain-containing protein n=1 Tax=Caldimicrobium thiodismutans TaxID=1653476 RepID=A0A0U5AWL0_9BACT|nr:HepT-like ribonuclease domain-containing protein [Caldimicrobium thiodismutans]BAU22958.1 hypothetical protein THC_0564 [Caldimicrobium thiodismutans]